MILLYLNEYFKSHVRRDAAIRLISYFALLIYGLLNLIDEKRKTYEQLDLIFLFFSASSLHSLMKTCWIINRQFDLVRLITRIFDLPANAYNLICNVYNNRIVRHFGQLLKIFTEYLTNF